MPTSLSKKPFFFGGTNAIVQKCSISSQRGSFVTIDLTLIMPSMFGTDLGALKSIDINEILGSEPVQKEIQKQIEEKLRTITFDDQ